MLWSKTVNERKMKDAIIARLAAAAADFYDQAARALGARPEVDKLWCGSEREKRVAGAGVGGHSHSWGAGRPRTRAN